VANVTGPVSTGTIGPIAALEAALAAGLNPFAAVVEAFRRSFGYQLPAVPGSSPPITITAPAAPRAISSGGGRGGPQTIPEAPPQRPPAAPPPAPAPFVPAPRAPIAGRSGPQSL